MNPPLNPPLKPHILVVEDQSDILKTLQGFLSREGYRVSVAADGLSALELFHQSRPDLILLDQMLPQLSGLELLRHIRTVSQTPVLFLTAKASEAELLEGFRAGADDYITKPFRIHEVLARVEAVLKRVTPESSTSPSLGATLEGTLGLRVLLERREVWLNQETLELTVSEFEVLVKLLQVPGRVFTRLELLQALSNERDTLERTIDTHIKNLRRKLGHHPALETVFGVGYRYVL